VTTHVNAYAFVNAIATTIALLNNHTQHHSNALATTRNTIATSLVIISHHLSSYPRIIFSNHPQHYSNHSSYHPQH